MTNEELRLECMRIALAKGGYVLTDEAGRAALRMATDALYDIATGFSPAATETPAEAAPAAAAPDKPEKAPAPAQAGKPGRL